MKRDLLAITIGVWLSAQAAAAHESLLRSIAAASAAIERAPRDATLYLRRGELHRLHRDWARARADLDRAAELDAGLAAVDLCRARLYLESGELGTSLALVSRYLASDPELELARTIRARVLAALGRPLEAASDYERALRQRPSPELYLEWADALVAAGARHGGAAIEALEEGVAVLGPVPALERRLIELELGRGDTEAALAVAQRARARSPRDPSWLVVEAEILESAERLDEARRSYESAQRALAGQPEHRRRTRMSRELEARIETALDRMGSER